MTLCEIDTSKMYSMHKKCLIVEDTTVTLCEIDTSKMYYAKEVYSGGYLIYCDIV